MKFSSLKATLLGAAVLAAALLPAKAADVNVDGNLKMLCGTATGSAAAATLNNKCGIITTESLTTAAGAVYTETITNSAVAATDQCKAYISAMPGAGTPAVSSSVAGAGSLVIKIQNIHASAAFNNTLGIGFDCIRP